MCYACCLRSGRGKPRQRNLKQSLYPWNRHALSHVPNTGSLPRLFTCLCGGLDGDRTHDLLFRSGVDCLGGSDWFGLETLENQCFRIACFLVGFARTRESERSSCLNRVWTSTILRPKKFLSSFRRCSSCPTRSAYIAPSSQEKHLGKSTAFVFTDRIGDIPAQRTALFACLLKLDTYRI